MLHPTMARDIGLALVEKFEHYQQLQTHTEERSHD